MLALATLMDDLLPKSNQAGLPNKSFLAFVWQIGLVAWETAAEAGRKSLSLKILDFAQGQASLRSAWPCAKSKIFRLKFDS